MDAYNIYSKLKDALDAISEYEKQKSSNVEIKDDTWARYSIDKFKELQTKMHVVGASGSTCPKCNGTGRI